MTTTAAGCDRVAAPAGSDSASGIEADPFQTVQRLLDSLQPGQTGCLRAGTFGQDQVSVWTPDVKLTSYPGETATVGGQLRVEATANGAVVEGLTLDGRNSVNRLGPRIFADRVVLRDNDISNGHTAICVHVGKKGEPAPTDVVIDGNRIHDCGVLPATNLHHGIYVAVARNTVIRNNWIYDNADRGIQLYPDADGSRITGNVIDGNGEGIIFGADDAQSSEENVVEGNVITNSTVRHNVESHSQGAPHGQGNVVRHNCIHGGARDDGDGGIDSPLEGVTVTDNLIADPQYVDRDAKNFALKADSACRAFLSESVGGSDPPPPTETTAPTIVSSSPQDGATAVPQGSAVSVGFDEAMDKPATEGAFSLAPAGDAAAPVAGSFSWDGDTMTFTPSEPLRAGTDYSAVLTTAARDLAGNALAGEGRWGFRTAPITVATYPGTAVVQTGKLRSGEVAALAADDGLFYSVNSTTKGTRTTSWYGRFTGVSTLLKNLKVTYRGSNSAACTQTVSIFRFTDRTWVTLDTRQVGTSEVGITSQAIPSQGDYVSSMGELRVRVRCTRSSNFYSSGDLMLVSYELP